MSVDSDIGEDANYGGHLLGANGYDRLQVDSDNQYSVVRQVDTDRVQIKIGSPTGSGHLTTWLGPAGASGPIANAFLPAAIEISPGTPVEQAWAGNGGRYNIVVNDGSFLSECHTEPGTVFTHMFENSGVTRYQSKPNEDVKGVVDVLN